MNRHRPLLLLALLLGSPPLVALLLGGVANAQTAPWEAYQGLAALDIPYANGPISREIGRAHV